MALNEIAGQMLRIACRFQPTASLKSCNLLFTKRSTSVSQLVKDIHTLTQGCRGQKLLLAQKIDIKKGFPVSFLEKAFSRTVFSGANGQRVLCLIKPLQVSVRSASGLGGGSSSKSNQTALIYIMAIFIFMIGAAYAGVPLYKVFCQVSGLGGQAVSKAYETEKIESMKKVERQIKIRFNADVASSMRWNFRPQQTEVTVLPGETALAFYTAQNPTSKPIIGISTYNVLPYDAGQYFNKIQCFCFEEQRLNPKEQVDMPVFFYIDPEFADDPKLENVNIITLSYTFFEAKEGLHLPLPGYPQPHDPVVST